MKIGTMLENNKGAIGAAVIAVIILSPVGYYTVARALPNGPEPFLERPDPEYRECVRDTEYMRYHHMDLLTEIRNEVVREGKRQDIGLDGCRECHKNRARFCDECHNTVNLHPDCFGCHYYPDYQQSFSPASARLYAAPSPGNDLSGR